MPLHLVESVYSEVAGSSFGLSGIIMRNHQLSCRGLCALLAGLVAGTAATVAGAQVSVSVDFSPSVLVFSPSVPVYIMGIGLNATGFTDDSHVDNFVRLQSSNGAFTGDFYPARGTGSGTAGSFGYASTLELSDSINFAGAWTLALTDGVTGITHTYSVAVSSSGIPDDVVRPITLDVVADTVIEPDASFTFSQDAAMSPEAEYSSAFAFLIGAVPGNFYIDPPIGVLDTSWTPIGPLSDDTYTFVVLKRNNAPDQSIVTAGEPEPLDGAPALGGFSTMVSAISSAQASGLRVGELPEIVVSARFLPDVISFSPLDPPVFILGVGVNATGFVDESNTNNFIEIHSRTNSFSGDFYPARGTGSGTAGSAGAASAADLSTLINDQSPWTLTVTDGLTNRVSRYTVEISTPGISDEYLRPITIAANPGDVISPNPTFAFTQAGSGLADAQYTQAFAALIGGQHYYGSPGLALTDTQWTPDMTVAPDTYTILVLKINDDAPQTLMVAADPVPLEGAPALGGFSYSTNLQSEAQVNGLTVGPTCAADFNTDGVLDPDDLADYIGAFFSQPPGIGSDFNDDGVTDPDDLADFIGAFFAGC